jgi:prevent-host-death family protein
MDMVQDIKPISFVKANAADLIDQINETRRPLIVTQNGEARAVMIDPVSYQNLQTGIKMFKLLAQSESEIQSGKKIGQKDLFSKIEKKLK